MIGTPREITSWSRRQPRVTSCSRSGDVGGIELPLVERTFDEQRWEVVGDDVLRERRVAANVALRRGVEHFGVEHADDVAEVEIAIGELGHVVAADVAEIAFVAFGHGVVESLGLESRASRRIQCRLSEVRDGFGSRL